jgi:hypothetical protein
MKFRCTKCELFYYFYWTLYLVGDNTKDLRRNLISTALKMIEVYDSESDFKKKDEIEKDIDAILNIAYKY